MLRISGFGVKEEKEEKQNWRYLTTVEFLREENFVDLKNLSLLLSNFTINYLIYAVTLLKLKRAVLFASFAIEIGANLTRLK